LFHTMLDAVGNSLSQGCVSTSFRA